MPHSRPWNDATPAIGDQLGNGYAEINNLSEDVNDRMQLEHEWAASTTYDGVHKPGLVAAVENQSTAAQIIAGAGDFGTAYTGSTAIASDTKVLYVKIGAENGTTGTWTPINTVRVPFGARNVNDSLGATLAKLSKYKVTSDGFVNVYATVDNSDELILYSDGNSSPVTVIGKVRGENSADRGSICAPVSSGDYWQVTLTSGTAFILWQPIGSGDSVKQ